MKFRNLNFGNTSLIYFIKKYKRGFWINLCCFNLHYYYLIIVLTPRNLDVVVPIITFIKYFLYLAFLLIFYLFLFIHTACTWVFFFINSTCICSHENRSWNVHKIYMLFCFFWKRIITLPLNNRSNTHLSKHALLSIIEV